MGFNYTGLCLPGSAFNEGYAEVQACITANAGGSTVDDFPDLQAYVNFCSQGAQVVSQAAQVTEEASQLSSIALSLSSVAISQVSVAWCSNYSTSYGSLAMNCTSSPAVTNAPSTTIFVTPTPTPSALTSTHENHSRAIAGGAVGGVAGLAMVVLAGAFFWRRRRKSLAPVDEPSTVTEKAQLHSDDVKPDRKELQGTEGSRDMLEKQPAEVAEMAANEEVVANNLKELPSNETPGHELETTENEMAALDRLARMTDSTILVHGSSKTDDSPEA